jgi:hypothetical protein
MTSFEKSASPEVKGHSRKWTFFVLVLLLLAGAEFIIRGPVRAVETATRFNDFLAPYLQSKAWVLGLDPYSPQVLLRLWPAEAFQFYYLPRETADGTLIAKRGIPTAYPLTALVLIAPFSFLSWKMAYALWLALNLTLFPAMVWALVAIAGFSYREPRAILLIAGTLALAPFHSGIVTGNVTLVAVELSVIALYAARRSYGLWSSFLLAVAAGLKPQIGLCFLLFYLVRGRWKIFGGAMAVLTGLAAIAWLRLLIPHTPWLTNYLNDSRTLLDTGVLGNFTGINPTRFGLINLQVALYPIIGVAQITNRLAMAIGVLFLVVWLIISSRRTRQEKTFCLEVLDISAIAVISLLPVYHRFYDAALLVLPLAWASMSFRRHRKIASLSLLLMLPFLVPGGTILQSLQDSGSIPGSLANSWWWNTIVMPHQVWALLLLSMLLLYAMAHAPGESAFRGGFR